jgi:hypothetical protein
MKCVFQFELFLKMKDTRTHFLKCVFIILNVSMAVTRTVVANFIEQQKCLFSISLNLLGDS